MALGQDSEQQSACHKAAEHGPVAQGCDAQLLQRPLVMWVGKLGPKGYWQWVEQPAGGHPRFFAHPLLEQVTKTPWWVVPLIWGPVFVGSAALAKTQHSWPLPALLALLAAGVVLWQLLEYLIHRFAFHSQPSSYWGITLHFLFHGCHHKFPSDALRLVMPPLPALGFALAVYSSLHAALPASIALPLFAGAGLGYIS